MELENEQHCPGMPTRNIHFLCGVVQAISERKPTDLKKENTGSTPSFINAQNTGL